jgi:hypothetical protein
MSKLFQVALPIAVIAAAASVAISHAQSLADPEQPPTRQGPPSNARATADNVEPAGPAMARGVPVMYFGVDSCGTKVFWLVMEDGQMFRLDREHHPKDLEAMMRSIQSLPHDLVEIPCATQL